MTIFEYFNIGMRPPVGEEFRLWAVDLSNKYMFAKMCFIGVCEPRIAFEGAKVSTGPEGVVVTLFFSPLRTFVEMFLSIFCFVRSGDRAEPNVGGTYMEPNYALWSLSTIGTKMEPCAGAQFRLAHDFPATHSPG